MEPGLVRLIADLAGDRPIVKKKSLWNIAVQYELEYPSDQPEEGEEIREFG